MVLISKKKHSLHDQESLKLGLNKRNGWFRVINYVSDWDKFVIELPEHYQPVLGTKDVRHETRKGVEKLFEEAKKQYRFRTESKKQVILYSFGANAKAIINDPAFSLTNNEYLKTNNYRNEYQENRHSLELFWVVCYETNLANYYWNDAKEDPLFYNIDGSQLQKPSNVKLQRMDYTPERERFFQEFSQSIGMMVYNIDDFLSQKDALLELIDSGKLLPFFDKKGKQE